MKTIYTLLITFTLSVFSTLAFSDSSVRVKIKQNPAHEYDIANPIVQKKLAFVHTLLKNTRANNSHRLNGQIGNQYYLRASDGAEAVFDVSGELVTGCVNRAKENLANPVSQPLAHFSIDVWPWLLKGNCKIPKSSAEERVRAYVKDIRDSLLLTVSNGAGFYLPESPSLDSANYATYFLFITKMERYGVDIETFMSYDILEKQYRDDFLKKFTNLLLRETHRNAT